MKRVLKIAVVAVAASMGLSGCDTHTGTALLAGVGGLVFGSAITNYANSYSQPRTVIVEHRPAVAIDAPQCHHYPLYSSERDACDRGAKQRYAEDNRRRNDEAFRTGLGNR